MNAKKKLGSSIDPGQAFTFFPIPLAGETVYSLLGRYLTRSPEPETHALKIITGKRQRTPLLSALPSHLNRMAALMPKGHPWKDTATMVNNHTALPYFTFFDSCADQAQLQIELESSDQSNSLGMKLGLTSYKCGAFSKTPRYCSECTKEDVLVSGVSYFRREHQLPGVVMCFKHRTPLAKGCQHCGPYPIKRQPLVPGKCHCKNGISPLLVDYVIPDNPEPLIWIAEQSSIMVSSKSLVDGKIRTILRKMVLNKGLGRGSILDYSKLAKAIEKRFGKTTLQGLGFPAWGKNRPAAWIRRLLHAQLDGKKRSPSIQFLLIIGTLFNSIHDFEKSVATLNTNVEVTSTNNHSLTSVLQNNDNKESPSWSNNFYELLQQRDLGLPGISKQLNVTTHALINEARKQNWHVPLSKQIQKKLGTEKIFAIKNALRLGMPKTEIMREYKCGEWALTLVEMDEPGLNATYHKSFRKNTRNRNRQRLQEHLQKKPSASRDDICKKLSGVYDFMIKHDKEWFFKQIQPRERTEKKPRIKSQNWSIIDEKKAEEIKEVFEAMLNSNTKPVQATVSAVLKKVRFLGKYNNDTERFPKISKILKNKVETRSNFIKRRLTWAIHEMARKQAPISINKLRRVASLPAETLRENKDFVIDCSLRSGAEISGNSFFSLS